LAPVSSVKQYDESQVNFYESHLCSKSDQALRLALALSGNLSAAKALVKKAYEAMASDLGHLVGKEDDALQNVCKAVWQVFHLDKKTDFQGQGVTNFFAKLSLEERALLVAVDGIGFTIGETVALFELNEAAARQHLSKARQLMMEHTL
jgi:hypothetical protein